MPLASRATTAELIRVLAYPKFHLSRFDQEEPLADFLPFTEVVDEPPGAWPGPEPRDPDDTMFLLLAHATGAEALGTGDRDLPALAGKVPFPVITPAELQRRVGP